MRISSLLLTVSLALIPGFLLGESEETRTCRILNVSALPGMPKKLQLFDGDSCREVELPSMNLSQIYALPAGPLTLRMLTEPVADPLKVPKEAPSIVVPKDFKHIYLLIRHDPENKVAPVKMRVVNASHDRIGRGEMLWINFSKCIVSGTIGNQAVEIQPGSEVLVKEPASGRENYTVELNYQAPGEALSQPLCESRWRHDPRSRSIALLIAGGKRLVPRLQSYTDYRHPSVEGKKKE